MRPSCEAAANRQFYLATDEQIWKAKLFAPDANNSPSYERDVFALQLRRLVSRAT
jgi:hypothetical protein